MSKALIFNFPRRRVWRGFSPFHPLTRSRAAIDVALLAHARLLPLSRVLLLVDGAKGSDEPATRIVPGNANALMSVEKAG